MIKKVSIVGMGSLGLLFGSLLFDKIGKDNVKFIVDNERFKNYKDKIRYVNGKEYDFKVVSEENTEKEYDDMLIIAVKSTNLLDAIDVVKNHVSEGTTIISLLNGINSEEIISNYFNSNQILYATAEGMDPIKADDKLNYTNMGYVCIGTDKFNNEKKERLHDLIEFFDMIEFPYKYEKNVIHRLWSKFMLNVGVNQVVMIYEGNFETIQKSGDARNLMLAAMREVITLAHKENVGLGEDDLNFYVSLVDTLNPLGMPSMRHDGLYKIKSEVEIFSGKVLELSKKHNIPVPVNEMIYNKIIEIESRY